MIVSPFHNIDAFNPPRYAFRGVCEHIFVKSCDGQQFSIVGDFLSEDLDTGRVGLQLAGNMYIISEDLTVSSDDTMFPPTIDGDNEIITYAGGVRITTTRLTS